MSRSPDRLARFHALSGLPISLYAALHLMNHAAAFDGPVAFSYFRGLLRHLYQFPAYELLMLTLPILFSAASGLWMLRRAPLVSTIAGPPSLRRRLHRWSGICLTVLVLPHAASTRGAALLWDIEPDFHFVARTLAGPRGAVFWLLYALLALAASFHLSNGLFTFLDEAEVFGGKLSRRAAAGAFLFVGVALAACGILGLLSYGGVLYPKPSFEILPPE